MLPTIFAIFVICSPDLMICKSMDGLARNFEQDAKECQEYVEVVENLEDDNAHVVMGKCTWTFNDGENHE